VVLWQPPRQWNDAILAREGPVFQIWRLEPAGSIAWFNTLVQDPAGPDGTLTWLETLGEGACCVGAQEAVSGSGEGRRADPFRGRFDKRPVLSI